MKKDQQKAYDSIVRQWNGGERRLAGARASELVYGGSNEPDEDIVEQLRKDLPGIQEYLSAPASGAIVNHVPDHGGNPLSDQPEAETDGDANKSSEQAQDEQNAIDKTLEKGRKARAKANKDDGNTSAGELVSTKLNPDEKNPEQA
ncbi:hypothetical protein [Agrobacterium cavarae]|uniref:hypothetical protein n=1 Tax=Agrobacterium cavarae TaxID=2528239 RepID=UPI002896F820|nr:hypothetical protein [Agrobacterium cavarae]